MCIPSRYTTYGKFMTIEVKYKYKYLDYLVLYCLRHREIKYDPDVVW